MRKPPPFAPKMGKNEEKNIKNELKLVKFLQIFVQSALNLMKKWVFGGLGAQKFQKFFLGSGTPPSFDISIYATACIYICILTRIDSLIQPNLY